VRGGSPTHKRKSCFGFTTLFLDAERYEAAKFLTQAGADPRKTSPDYYAPYDLAKRLGNEKMRQILKSAGQITVHTIVCCAVQCSPRQCSAVGQCAAEGPPLWGEDSLPAFLFSMRPTHIYIVHTMHTLLVVCLCQSQFSVSKHCRDEARYFCNGPHPRIDDGGPVALFWLLAVTVISVRFMHALLLALLYCTVLC
jgi:hypothetical protein